MISFDTILDNHIKTGMYQLRTFLIIGLIEFCDGIEYVFMSILMKILQKEWALGKGELATLGSSYLAGVVGGNIICAFITDSIGRKATFTTFSGLSVFLVYYMSFATSYEEIIISRFLFGVVFGVTSPLGFLFISEVSVTQYRGRFSFSMTIMYVAGKIYLVLLCFIFLDGYSSGNWRGLIRFNGIPIGISFLCSIFFLDETIRYYLNKGKYQKAFKEIEHMQYLNVGESSQPLTTLEKDGLISWQIRLNKLDLQKDHQLEGLFSQRLFWVTIQLVLLSIFAQLQNMSIYLLIPFLFDSHNSGFEAMLLLFTIELLFVIFIYFFIDNPKYGGRVRILFYSSILLVLTNFSLFIFQGKVLFFGILMIKLAIRVIQSIIYILTCESYPLHLRSEACGIIQAIGRLATIPSPYIFYPLYYHSEYLPFGFLIIVSILMTITAYTFKDDRTLKHLEASEMNSEQ